MPESPLENTVAELSSMLDAGELSSEELLKTCIERTDRLDATLNAFNGHTDDAALEAARASDRRRAEGCPLSPLDGIPVGIKDVIACKGEPLTCSSRMLEGFIAPYDAHVVERLRLAGAIPWGRLNLDEFAMGSSTENSAFGRCKNPWNEEHVPGGSSGGCAAAVSARLVPVSLGSDTGGSIRQPAAFCGVVGIKPTYGLVSRYGLVAFASSLDQIGPFAKTVHDAALLLDAVAGNDPRDSTSICGSPAFEFARACARSSKRRLGIPREYFSEGLHPEVRSAVEEAIKWYAAAGHEIIEISLPTTELAVPVYYIIAPAEASSNLARFDGVRYGHRSNRASDAIDLYTKSRGEGFGKEVKRRVILGTYVLSSGYYDAYYNRAQKARTLIRRDFEKVFEEVDAILTPTTPTTAFAAGEKSDNPLEMYLNDIFTINVNLAGLPALSLPCGFAGNGLPVGLQIIGKPLDESTILSLAHEYETAKNWWKHRPPLQAI